MDLLAHYRMLAYYNRVANERLYDKCAQLDEAEYSQQRKGSFGSIHALLNHILLSDRIWMARFQGGSQTTPRLSTILFDELPALRTARAEQDRLMEVFFEQAGAEFFEHPVRYFNSEGKQCVEQPSVAVTHFFNHQTHHRGQIHVMLSQTPVAPPSLDLHRIVNPL